MDFSQLKYCFSRIAEEKFPLRFILSRMLWRTGLCRFFRIQRDGYQLCFHPNGLSAGLWKDPSLFRDDGEIICALLHSGDTYVDIGANIGHLVIEAALKVGPLGKVFAFEAHPRTAMFLRKNVQLNRLAHQVYIAQCAVGESFGWVKFTDKLTDDQNCVADTPGCLALPVIPLDSLLEEISLTVLKIDVEGFEKFVLQGASRLLERTEFIYFEAYEKYFASYGYSFVEIRNYLESKGFFLGVIDIQNKKFFHLEDNFIPTICLNILAYKDMHVLKKKFYGLYYEC